MKNYFLDLKNYIHLIISIFIVIIFLNESLVVTKKININHLFIFLFLLFFFNKKENKNFFYKFIKFNQKILKKF